MSTKMRLGKNGKRVKAAIKGRAGLKTLRLGEGRSG